MTSTIMTCVVSVYLMNITKKGEILMESTIKRGSKCPFDVQCDEAAEFAKGSSLSPSFIMKQKKKKKKKKKKRNS